MKKSLSLILAVVLAFGASATAFADHTARGSVSAPAIPAFTGSTIAHVYTTNSDGAVVTTTTNAALLVSNTKALYLELDTSTHMKAADIMKYKVRAEFTVGADLIDSASIVYKKGTAIGANKGYAYFVEIKAKQGVKLSKDDLQGEIIVYKSSYKGALAPQKFAFGIGVIGEADIKFTDSGANTVYPTSVAGTPKVVSFDKNNMTETTITFDTVGEFEVNVFEQDKLYLGFDMKANADIIAKHSYANMEFVNFPGKPAFYRTGLFYMYADDEASFVYEVKADGTIAPVKSTWDAEYDAHKFAVRQFAGTYIISDVELQLEATPVVPGTETKPNPNTGR